MTEQERDARVGSQIEKWRAAAGFKGTSTEVNYDARGKIEWLIDLDPTGRIILHAGKRTFYGSLHGQRWWGSAMNWKFPCAMISGPKTIRGWPRFVFLGARMPRFGEPGRSDWTW